RGIGLEHARRYAERGARVFATARKPDEAGDLAALAKRHAQVEVLAYDAMDDGAPAALKDRIGAEPLDLMFANAGAMGTRRQSFGDVDTAAVLNLIRVNALAPLKLAEALVDNVAQSERRIMAFQTSLMGSIADNGSGGAYAYRLSKVALNMVGKGVANDLRGRGVIAVLLHPGWVRTRMGGPGGKISVEECVEGQQRVLDALTPEHSGRFYNYDGRELRW
ncbi:MAG TPA: SDR family oxidoreductase, partial [Candidatus Binatia bacterium]|nr:SDR family oxidoreductase [Candidatus Binatia bacterium]